MAKVLEVGQRVRFDHTETIVQRRTAAGKYNVYEFADGRTYKGDVDVLILGGRLVLLEDNPEVERSPPLVDGEALRRWREKDHEDLPEDGTDWEE